MMDKVQKIVECLKRYDPERIIILVRLHGEMQMNKAMSM